MHTVLVAMITYYRYRLTVASADLTRPFPFFLKFLSGVVFSLLLLGEADERAPHLNAPHYGDGVVTAGSDGR